MKASALDYTASYASARSAIMARNVVATSQPLAAQAGLSMLHMGGNAVDAAIAAAMALVVVEPTGCGLGSDAFAIVWDGARLHGLNASGRSPAAWSPARFAGRSQMPERGWDAVTTPGAVSGWIALHERFGSLPLETAAAPAIALARSGFLVSAITAALWAKQAEILASEPGFADAFLPGGRPPKAGELFRLEALARSLELIASSAGKAFYQGELADRIAAFARAQGGALATEDLGNHKADWVELLSQKFANGSVHELPPNGQGIATLIGLGLLEARGLGGAAVDDADTIHCAIEATKLALVDVYRYVADETAMEIDPRSLLEAQYLLDRSRLIDPARAGDPGHGEPRRGGTVYLTAADSRGMMISFIQSNYMGFGSGLVVPGTGISLQNRGACFVLRPGHPNCVGPSKRPFHTIIPAFALDANQTPLMSFGVMGGAMQAQGHLQMALRIMANRQNPQAAIDAPRWRVLEGRRIAVEAAMPSELIAELRSRGHDVSVEPASEFGGAQVIIRDSASGHYVAGSDPRKDGQAVGF